MLIIKKPKYKYRTPKRKKFSKHKQGKDKRTVGDSIKKSWTNLEIKNQEWNNASTNYESSK